MTNNINQIFNKMCERAHYLEKVIYEKIEGNSEENEYVYDEDARNDWKKELKILEDTIYFLEQKIASNEK